MAQTVYYGDMLSILKLAYEAGIDCDRKGFVFRCGETSDDYASDGGMPASGWYHWACAFVADQLILGQKERVEGPWMDDLPAVLEEIKTETLAKLESRREAAIKAEQKRVADEKKANDKAYNELVRKYNESKSC